MRCILAIDGGGVKGVLPASLLATIEDAIDGRIIDYFDLIVGTSTGGIIALGLAAGIPAAEIRDFYLSRGPRIFEGNRLARAGRHWVTAKYNEAGLRAELNDIFGSRRLGESTTRLVIPSMDVNSGRVHLWKTAHHPHLVQDYKQPIVDVAMATSAAPSYFKAFLSETGAPLIDGGVFANNPAGLAAVEAVGILNWPREDIAILSIGCGKESLNVRAGPWWRSGKLGVARNMAAVLMAAQSDASNGAATHLLGDRRNFVRLNPQLPNGRYGLDITKELTTLRAHGDTEARHRLEELRGAFFSDEAEAFVPDHRLA
jgi:patatin-like phospholipase/acyl hydrolase